jgi:signal transduction histidine kinase
MDLSLDPQRTLAQLLVTMMNTREVEYARVSRLLHDEVGQVLSAVGLQLDVLRMDFKSQVPEMMERTIEIQKMLEQAVVLVRDLSYELNPAIVERAGLQFALDRLVSRYRKSCPGALRLLTDASVHVPLSIANILYKIAEHAVENAVKHAQCTQIEVLLRPTQKKMVTLEIRDNGVGFSMDDVQKRAPGLGFILMEYYTSQAGLDLSIKSTLGKGTTVKVSYQQ